jgi:exopolyphosphatase/guanosine-5'-triphosphate,3'-diphosphate pyrophosphatase
LRLAAIDIGSNAVRLLINEVERNPSGEDKFQKLNLIRVPIRLGFDVFENQEISEEKEKMLVETLKAFKHIMNAYEVNHFKICATSAMRDAGNSKEIIQKVRKETGLEIEVITGELEANLIYENHIAEHLNKEHDYIYIDVGGGSTEISIFSNGSLSYKQSFNIGAIRLLKGKVSFEDWEYMKQEIKNASKNMLAPIAIGSGGNINKIFSMSKKKEGKSLKIELLRDYQKELSSVSVEDRIELYQLRADRADVIVPALQIYINAMRWADSEEIFVPKIGLADGLIQHLWDELK